MKDNIIAALAGAGLGAIVGYCVAIWRRPS